MPKSNHGSKEERLAMDAYVKLMRAAETVSSSTHRHLAEVDLTPSQFGVLEALYHLGSMCQRDLGRKILKSSGNITTVIDNLEKRGLVQRRREQSDRRFISIHLLPGGKELIQTIFPRHMAGIADKLSVLPKEEQVELARICRKLGLGSKPR
ncbi:MarR family transcriptional regulator [Desulfuromonas versatilis]|uniref:MarR family transcriptional regulator n=1 Tax=Desulfuromonas versatilis TaxID=2802975 RepID=A0ABN6E0T6_9BACT|nr:MarR family transcriptional regulator [Desulfuromonas versatilis]BCR05849.1 MarR family transcriptional regulator [Desulfuromonas versatilis]